MQIGLVMTIVAAVSGVASADGKVVILQGPRADRWFEAAKSRAECVMVEDLSEVPRGATVVLPDRTLSSKELAALPTLVNNRRILALGRSVFTEGGPTAAGILHVGKDYYYVPLLYSLNGWGIGSRFRDPDTYRARAQWCARQGAQGLGLFTFGGTLPERVGQQMTDTIGDCFKQFGDWKPRPWRPALVGLPGTAKVLFMHTSDVERMEPEAAAEWAEQLGANVIAVIVSRFRDQGIYDSRFLVPDTAPEHAGADNDVTLLPRLIEAFKQRKIAVWANILGGPSSIPVPESQQQVLQDGSLFGRGCPLRGAAYYDTLAQIMEEVLIKFPYITCITLDEPQIRCSGWKQWGCFCEQCQEAFQKEYGYELTPENAIVDHGPDKHQSLTEDFHRFRIRLMNEGVFEKYRRAVNRVRPGTPLLVWAPTNYGVSGIEPQSAVLYGLNAYGPEYRDGPGGPDEYLNHPRQFLPRAESIVALRDTIGKLRDIATSITRVDCFADAEVISWGQAADRSWWPVMVSTWGGSVRYCAFDPLSSEGGDSESAASLLKWLTESGS